MTILSVRLPDSLHKRARSLAKEEHISINKDGQHAVTEPRATQAVLVSPMTTRAGARQETLTTQIRAHPSGMRAARPTGEPRLALDTKKHLRN
ncbi:MAG: toxin-antitoxin system HicB family antitoxin [Lentisphaeria bacterium]|nr:toxin-antitoxin system HicB family antitoxin [Lentisphaeria bacterium]